MTAPRLPQRVCVVTATRAEYGLLRWVMEEIRAADDLALQVVVTGAHLEQRFGFTAMDIERDGFAITRRIPMALDGDSPSALARALGDALTEWGPALAELQPDLLVVLGDRYELLAPVSAATLARIPIAHLHGGEATTGAFDDAIRHAITKLAHLHFVAAEPYRRRVVQMGEAPERVFLVGGLGVDAIHRLRLLERTELEHALGVPFAARNLLVTFHPATLAPGSTARQMEELLAALAPLQETRLLFTMPNADPEHGVIFDMIAAFVDRHSNARAYPSMGQLRYLSCLRFVDGVVGNSSSGLTEVPSFRKGTINIGDRQHGRLAATSVIDCPPERAAIAAALDRLYSPGFRANLATVRNPYGEGGASERIVTELRRVLRCGSANAILQKRFHDLPDSGDVSQSA